MGVFCYIYLRQVFIIMGKKIKVRLSEQGLIDLISKHVAGGLGGNENELIKKLISLTDDKTSQSGNKDNSKEDSSNIKSTTTSDDDFYKKVLSCVGAKPTKDNMSFMYAWRQAEGGKATNNPFNTTHKMPGSTPYASNTHGVKNYVTPEDGIQATCRTLKNGRYNDIINGLKNDIGLFELSRLKSLNVWGTGPLLAKVADGYLKGATPKPQDIA